MIKKIGLTFVFIKYDIRFVRLKETRTFPRSL
jgi:hypothetical protein